MSKALRIGWMALCGIAGLLAADAGFAQAPSSNPYRPVRGLADGGGPSIPGGEWARLPGGREMGPPASVHVDIDGEMYRIYFEESGEGIPLVCLHTAGSDGRQWRHLLADKEFAKSFRIIAFDMPWHGKSSPPAGWHEEEYQLTSRQYMI